jgi:hypothetical protein
MHSLVWWSDEAKTLFDNAVINMKEPLSKTFIDHMGVKFILSQYGRLTLSDEVKDVLKSIDIH